jgi:ubiquinone biosynthesis protein
VISSLAHLVRLARAGFVFAREGVFGMVDPASAPPPARAALYLAHLIERPRTDSNAGRLSAALTRLGPTYVKLGQFLATRPDIVGAPIAHELESLQDKMPPFPQAEAEAAIEKAFGLPLNQVFASFGPAVAAASIAQVHRAEVETPDGRKAGRGQGAAARYRAALQGRPGCFMFAARNAEGFSSEAQRLRMIEDGGDLAPLGRARNGSAAGSGGALGAGGEHQGGSGFPRAVGRLAAHGERRPDAGMDRSHAPVQSSTRCGPRASTCRNSARA